MASSGSTPSSRRVVAASIASSESHAIGRSATAALSARRDGRTSHEKGRRSTTLPALSISALSPPLPPTSMATSAITAGISVRIDESGSEVHPKIKAPEVPGIGETLQHDLDAEEDDAHDCGDDERASSAVLSAKQSFASSPNKAYNVRTVMKVMNFEDSQTARDRARSCSRTRSRLVVGAALDWRRSSLNVSRSLQIFDERRRRLGLLALARQRRAHHNEG